MFTIRSIVCTCKTKGISLHEMEFFYDISHRAWVQFLCNVKCLVKHVLNFLHLSVYVCDSKMTAWSLVLPFFPILL